MGLFKKNTASIIIAPTPAILITSDINMKKSQLCQGISPPITRS